MRFKFLAWTFYSVAFSLLLICAFYLFFVQKNGSTFYLSNQAVGENRWRIDIKVFINDEMVINDTLPVGDYHLYKYHTKRIGFGYKKIRVVSIIGTAILEKRVFVLPHNNFVIEYYDYDYNDCQKNNKPQFFTLTKRFTTLKIS